MNSENSKSFTPILLGSDFNVYGMARSLYEKYGKPVKAYAEKSLAPTRYTKIVDLTLIPGFSEDPTWINEMMKLKQQYANHKEPVILIGCGDGYAQLISKHQDELKDVFICPYVNYHMLRQLNSKENFYKICDQYHLPYPKTIILTKQMYKNHDYENPFGYPVALKPTNSVEWLDIHFKGRKKAFVIKSKKEFITIVNKIYENGYTSDLIVQEYVGGEDRTLNAYVDKNHHVKMMCLGYPLLEDPSPSSIGNYVAILPDYNQKIYQVVQKFLESIQYTGYANFDLKYDSQDHSFKFFEINLRQGRSSFFVTLCGYNLADWVIQDYVFDSLKDKPTLLANRSHENYNLWLGVGVRTFKKYTKESHSKSIALDLLREHRYGSTFWYSKDRNFKRWLLLEWMQHIYAKNFSKYSN
ncbi:carboxylate--amine ligase [Philodulcilactobacillus myokoensis]|uniref:Carboxylate--amine ligase n=1 Tax=Philodulcilactobacillus myokoensis TaxID=2929573 RepID=A0A9W6B0G7_9LACO|nr:carboxylate--amine ligase [Philodulcilactobacillus myokoensis]GLB46729.1 carboxylate--amine ligase [Philodulcilactobacillus myokoensis]